MQLSLHAAARRVKVVLAVSRHGHCLNHLLHQWQAGEPPIEVVGIVSNHDDMRRLVEWHGIPYHHLPIVDGDKLAQESRFLWTIADSGAEMTVLARYMQVLSDDACRQLEGRCKDVESMVLAHAVHWRAEHSALLNGHRTVVFRHGS